MKKKILFGVMSIMAFGMVLTGCASVPKAFVTAQSLAGTQWGKMDYQGDLVEFHDAASGVYTDADGKEIPFTYTAPYNAKKRTFTGKLTRADGTEWEFTVKSALGMWDLWNQHSNRQYLFAEQLQNWKGYKGQQMAFAEQYGKLYVDERLKGTGMYHTVLKREMDGKQINFIGRGCELGFFDGRQYLHLPYILHSKDGVTITMKKDNFGKGSFESASVPIGTFKVSFGEKEVTGVTDITGKPVFDTILTISDGTGEGVQFNGTWLVKSSYNHTTF